MSSDTPSSLGGILEPGMLREPYAYLETVGRRSGRRRVVELWFGADERADAVYFLAGGGERTHWVRNIDAQPRVRVRIAGHTFTGVGRRIAGTDREQAAREMLARKYQRWTEGRPLSQWARTALPIAIDLEPTAPD